MLGFADDCERKLREAWLELMSMNKELNAKNLVIRKLEKNNDKFVSLVQQKHQWEEYQLQLQ